MFRTMRKRSGSSAMTGRVFKATGLYFFFAARIDKGFRGDGKYGERSLSDILTGDRVRVLERGVDKAS
jgi:hypothetical protein